MKYTPVKVETMQPGAKFAVIKNGVLQTYIIIEHELDDWYYEMQALVYKDGESNKSRYGFSHGTLVFAEDP